MNQPKKTPLPEKKEDLKALLTEETQKLCQLEAAAAVGRLNKISDLAASRRRIAQILTKINMKEDRKR